VTQIEGYLFRTASNVVIDYHRRATVRRVGDQIEYDDDLHAPDALSPERVLLGREELDRLTLALRELPERVRAVIILSRLEGFTHAEIARHLDISKSSVEKYMIKATTHLMRRLGRAPR
jgi:RNA polymerase sigma-19 factor, ECF subfamily